MGFSAKIIGEIKNNKSTSLIISEITTVTCHLIFAFTQQYLAKIKKKCVHLYLHFIITDFFLKVGICRYIHTYFGEKQVCYIFIGISIKWEKIFDLKIKLIISLLHVLKNVTDYLVPTYIFLEIELYTKDRNLKKKLPLGGVSKTL